MNETREDLLQNLTYVQQMLKKIINTYSSYIQLERNFRTTQASIGTDGVANRIKLAAITVGCTIAAFILLVSLISGDFESLIILAVAAGVVAVNRKKKSKLKSIAILVILLLLAASVWSIAQAMSIGTAIILILLLAAVVAGEWFFITRRNKSVAEYNKKVEANNQAVQAQRMTLYNQYEALREELLSRSGSWFPPSYYNIEAVNFFVDVVANYRASTVKEMVNLFEQTSYQQQMITYQQQQSQQLNQLIAGQQEVKGQLRYANMINTASLFQLQGINAGVRQLHQDASRVQGAIGSLQGSLKGLSSEVTKIKNMLK